MRGGGVGYKERLICLCLCLWLDKEMVCCDGRSGCLVCQGEVV